jgi:hypothetical protein
MAAGRYPRGIAEGRKGEGFPGRRSLWPDGGHPAPNIGGWKKFCLERAAGHGVSSLYVVGVGATLLPFPLIVFGHICQALIAGRNLTENVLPKTEHITSNSPGFPGRGSRTCTRNWPTNQRRRVCRSKRTRVPPARPRACYRPPWPLSIPLRAGLVG